MTTKETATLAGGCFWCLEAVYTQLRGIESLRSGYAGGHVPYPTYQQVCSESTGHAEVVQLIFDPQEISYQDILRVFFSIHDPTTLNRQGHDIGTQYRSAIFYHEQSQKDTAEQLLQELAELQIWSNPIVTELAPLEKFYPAEEYHHEYFAMHPNQPYCMAVIAPKVAKFRKVYLDRLKK